MSYLLVNSYAVPIDAETGDVARTLAGAKDAPREDGGVDASRQAVAASMSFSTILLPREEAEGVEGLIGGLHHRFPLQDMLFSTRGRAPTLTDATFSSPGVIGDAYADVGADGVSWDFSTGIAPLRDRWWVATWRNDGGTWSHWLVRSDGAVWFNGVRDDTVNPEWLSVSGAVVAIAEAGYDELVVGCYCPSDAQAQAFVGRFLDLTAWSDAPALDVEGSALGDRRQPMVGVVSGSRGGERARGGDEGTNPDGGTFENAARAVSFSLSPRRVIANAAGLPPRTVRKPSLWYSADSTTIDTGLMLDSATTTNASSAVITTDPDAQARQGIVLDGSATAGYSIGDLFGPDVDDAVSISMAVLVSGDAPANAEMTLMSKGLYGTEQGFFLRVEPQSDGLVDVRFVFADDPATTQMNVVAANAFLVDEWHHVVATYDGRGNADGLRLYVDGARVGTVIDATPPAATTNNRLLCIGQDDLLDFAFNGKLDEIGYWFQKALSPGEARALFQAAAAQRRGPWGST